MHNQILMENTESNKLGNSHHTTHTNRKHVWRESPERLSIVLAYGVHREEVGEVKVRVDSQQDVGYVCLEGDKGDKR